MGGGPKLAPLLLEFLTRGKKFQPRSKTAVNPGCSLFFYSYAFHAGGSRNQPNRARRPPEGLVSTLLLNAEVLCFEIWVLELTRQSGSIKVSPKKQLVKKQDVDSVSCFHFCC